MKPFEELEFCDGFLFAATLVLLNLNTRTYSTRYTHQNCACESSRRNHYKESPPHMRSAESAVDSQTHF